MHVNKKAVIGFSGGMDSTTLLAYYLNQGYEVECVHFQYGSKHNRYEIQSVDAILKYYQIELEKKRLPGGCKGRVINIESIYQGIDSNLLSSGGRIPEGHYEDEIMKATKVPGRNLIILSILAAIAESIGGAEVGIGVHAGDRAIYPDCRWEFVYAANQAIRRSSESKVHVYAPFIDDKKKDIIGRTLTMEIPVPFYLTRTCYKDQLIACGKCGSCQERREAFKEVGIPDPIGYEDDLPELED